VNINISLGDEKYFHLFIGNRVLKEEIFGSTDGVPLYSANVFKPFGYLEKSNIDDFSKVQILWGIDGIFEFNIMPAGVTFATTDHCGVIRILDEKIVPEYLLYQLRLKGHLLGYDRSLRPSLAKMREVEISFPTDNKGNLDKQKQEEISRKYGTFLKIKKQISAKVAEFEELSIDVKFPTKVKRMKVGKIFDSPPTNSGITKEYCLKNEGEIPVYGCSQSESSILGKIQNNLTGVRYYENSLTWNRNGSVGKVFYRKGRFSTNEDHRVLEIREEYKDEIDLLYIKNVLENEIKTLGYGFTNKLGKNKMDEIEITLLLMKREIFHFKNNRNLEKNLEKFTLCATGRSKAFWT
jgi:hypothetical protein